MAAQRPAYRDRRRSSWKSRPALHQRRLSPRLRRLRFEPLEDRLLLNGAMDHQALELFDTSPAHFVENQGQWGDESLRYAFHGSGANVLLTDAGPVFQLFQRESRAGETDHQSPDNSPDDLFGAPDARYELAELEEVVTRMAEFSVSFDGANQVEPVGLDRAETVYNYYLGDQSNWRTGVTSYEKICYPDLYEAIDLLTWGRRNSLKYEFHVAPGGDYRQIQVSYDGIDGLWLDAAGALHVETALGELIDDAPYIYQQLGGETVEVAGQFELVDADTYSFTIAGAYDPSMPLIIDPDLAWSTYLGGNELEWARGIAVDGSGNALVTGQTASSGWVWGGDATYNGGDYDAFVAKLSPTGQHVWSTYLGGNQRDEGEGIAVDGSGNALVTGWTLSSGWVSGGFDTIHNDGLGVVSDAFVAKLSPIGQHVWSTYLGGSEVDRGNGIAVDGSGNALVTGYTDSPGWVSGGFDTTLNVSRDAFVAKLSPIGQHVWSTYLGGSEVDQGNGIAVDGSGSALVTGLTLSFGWVSGGFDTSYNGSWDAFAAKLSPIGQHVWSSYLGGNDSDAGFGIAVDGSGNALVTGQTGSSGWVWGGDATYNGGDSDAFVATLSPIGQHFWSTYLGGNDSDVGYGIAVDGSGSALVTGVTGSQGWVGRGLDTTYNGGSADAFVAKLSPIGQHVWSSYLGGNDSDGGYGIAVDGSGNALVTGVTSSQGWVSGGFDAVYNGGDYDAFVAKIRPWQPIGSGWSIAGAGDLDGDGTDDVLLQNSTTGLIGAWIVQNGAYQRWSSIGTIDPVVWDVVGVGRLNGDGTDDVLLRNSATGMIGAWIINNGSYQSWSSIGKVDPTVWDVAGVGYFNADVYQDVLLSNSVNGLIGVWMINNAAYQSYSSIGVVDHTVWDVAGVGDFDGDFRPDDLLLRNSATGLIGTWITQNGAYQSWSSIGKVDPTAWDVAGAGDFNPALFAWVDDVLLRNSVNGLIGVWLINNAAYQSYSSIGKVDPTVWDVAGVGDFDGDGTEDVLLRNFVTGLIGTWIVNDGAYERWSSIGVLT